VSSLRVSRSVVVAAAPNEIFDLLADPAQHHAVDGSGTVKGSVEGAPARLSLGATFGISMKVGMPYRITNTVTEFVENQSIAWQHFGKHTWRYELEPLDGGASTKVTETFDGTTSRLPVFLSITRAGQRNAKSIEATLAGLQQRFATRATEP
jgi:Polyketide cyclase / dehydrase and lipid transport